MFLKALILLELATLFAFPEDLYNAVDTQVGCVC